jgi:hypothetical protein
MSLLKYVTRLKRMDDLIRRTATGTPHQFCTRLGIGKTILMEELKALKELGADVDYNKLKQSYYYKNNFMLKIGCLNELEKNKLKGGQNILYKNFPVRYY